MSTASTATTGGPSSRPTQKEPSPAHELHADIGPQHEEGAVREVENAHHAKDRGEAHRNQKQQHAPRQAVQEIGQETFHGKFPEKSRKEK